MGLDDTPCIVRLPSEVMPITGDRQVSMTKETTGARYIPDSNSNMWRNTSIELYRAAVGEREFLQRKATQFQTPTEFLPRVKLACTVMSLQAYLGIKAFFTSKRGSHGHGMGAKGYAIIDPDNNFPKDEFFQPGKRFDVRVRFANVRVSDDAMLDGRSFSIKFQDSDDESPLDLVMETGKIAPFNNIAELKTVLRALSKGGDILKTHCLAKPFYYESLIEMGRRNPDSFANLHYYGQQNYFYADNNGRKFIARFRCVPTENIPESGLISEEEQKTVWELGRLPGETRSKTYLREEMHDRLKTQNVQLTIQAQLHNWCPLVPAEVYNCGEEWNEKEHPWMNVARVTLDKALDNQVTEGMRMDISHRPTSLNFFGANSVFDFNSIPYARLKVYPVSHAMRKLRNNMPALMLISAATASVFLLFKSKLPSLWY